LNVATYCESCLLNTRQEAHMKVTTLSSPEFDQDTSGARKAAQQGPVFITDRGRPAHVLLTIEDYRRLTGSDMSLAEALAQPDDVDFDFDPPRVGRGIAAELAKNVMGLAKGSTDPLGCLTSPSLKPDKHDKPAE
jgi:PHD/YefM family antitoxin component YafN of YafNO toxin-antitoxin module